MNNNANHSLAERIRELTFVLRSWSFTLTLTQTAKLRWTITTEQ